jgi:two-component system response regulator HydG
MNVRLAVVGNDVGEVRQVSEPLVADGYEVVTFTDGFAALQALEHDATAIKLAVVTGATGALELCAALVRARPALSVLVVAAEAQALLALRAGACDLVPRPVEAAVLLTCVRRALVARVSPRLRPTSPAAGSAELLGESVAMQQVREVVRRVASSGASVLIHGETGTGKELAARALHASSPRARGPFVAIDCAALPGPLLESELFGFARGAFTDARAARSGLFVEASGGSLFLDEVAELSLDHQARVLRALQERRVRPVGSNLEVPFDVRVMCATHKDLEAEVAAGRFRQDLFFRLNVVRVFLPPLRERGLDVVHLAKLFLARARARDGAPMLTLPAPVTQRLLHHRWPGNVRELENCMEQLAALARGTEVEVDDLPRSMRAAAPQAPAQNVPEMPVDQQGIVTLDELEKHYVLRVLELLKDNRSRAADVLGIDRRTLYRRLEGWGLPTWRTPPPPPHAAVEQRG